MDMDLDSLYVFIKKQSINEIIKDLEDLEFPPEWRPRDVLGFVIKKLQEKEMQC
jgi:hypothetical protein